MSTSATTHRSTARYTYTCLDCAHNAGAQRWGTLAAATHAAALARHAHARRCRARLVAVSLPTASCGPDDPVPIPAWAAAIARSLTAVVAHRATQRYTLDLAHPRHTALLTEAVLAFDPIPGTTLTNAGQLATLLHHTADTITASTARHIQHQ